MVYSRGLLRSQENVDDINLVSSRKDLSAARKKRSIQASTRCAHLFGLIKQKKWDEVLHKLDYYESDAKEWIEENNDDGTTRWKSLLIHLVCERKPPAEVVRQLLRIYPGSVAVKNYGGDLPIHIACREGASKEVIEMILNNDEFDCAKEADCEGRLPLHLAVSNKNISLKTIQNLIKVNERATRTPDDFKLLPLHWACSKSAHPRIVETIIQAYPYAVETQDAWGRTPHALAKMSKNPDKAEILELLSRDVSSWTTAMMSTVVTLSNKVMEAEKMEEAYREQARKIEEYEDLEERKDKHIDALRSDMLMLEQRFQDDIQYLKDVHAKELAMQKKESDEIIAQLKQEKEEAEKKLADLKKLVDEVVTQLKEHQALVEEKESERKKLKERAVALLQKIEDQKAKTRSTHEENQELKQERNELQRKLKERDEHLAELKTSFQQPMRMLNQVREETHDQFDGSTIGDTRYSHTSDFRRRDDYYSDHDERESRGNIQCTRLDNGSTYS